jgi:NAD(P)-dependent dehydrogenase (short-subunit alcohol dehydrogenase family)
MSETPLVLVTGATDGIGLETARELARRGASVLLHGRDARRLDAARKLVAKESRSPLEEPVRADFASLEGVRELVRELDRRRLELTVLINNAGIYCRELRKSADGFELTFAVNHLAPFLLTHLVLAGKSGSKLERVVNVSSIAHGSGSLDLADPDGTRAGFEGYGAYAASKLANVLFTVELARRVTGRRIDVNALHPGVVSTKLLREGFGMGGPDSLEEGAATSVFLTVDPSVRGTTGRYFVRCRAETPSAAARDAAFARRFYELSCKLTGATPIRAAVG